MNILEYKYANMYLFFHVFTIFSRLRIYIRVSTFIYSVEYTEVS